MHASNNFKKIIKSWNFLEEIRPLLKHIHELPNYTKVQVAVSNVKLKKYTELQKKESKELKNI